MRRAPILLVAGVILLLLVARWVLGNPTPAAPERTLTPEQQEQFRLADADSSGHLTLDEFWFWIRRQERPTQQRPQAGSHWQEGNSVSTASPMKASVPPQPQRSSTLSSPTVATMAAVAGFDNSFMKLRRQETLLPPPSPAVPGPTYRAPDYCHPMLHAGYAGGSLSWGMTFKVESAAECCEACRAHAKVCRNSNASGSVYYTRIFSGSSEDMRCAATMSSNEDGTHKALPCNVWVYCPTPVSEGGLCWSNDVWNHTTGECWLKNQPNPARPWAGAYGEYPEQYRRKHRSAPQEVQWMSGSLTAVPSDPIKVDGPHWHW
jgi:hypothetical protein